MYNKIHPRTRQTAHPMYSTPFERGDVGTGVSMAPPASCGHWTKKRSTKGRSSLPVREYDLTRANDST